MNTSSCDVAIIGAGFSGTLVATQLLQRASSPLAISLIERSGEQFGRGVAYSTVAACHLLNVPASNMSAFPDDPGHFFRWAQTQEATLIDPPWVPEVTNASFLPRRCYGAYLRQVLDQAERQAAAGVRLERILDEAVGLNLQQNGVGVRLAGGETLRASQVVLALGNFRPGNPSALDQGFYDSPRYHGDPWAADVLQQVLTTDSCLLIGSGLTMVDWALALSHAGYQGTIHAISRRGLWPQAHAGYPPVAFSLDSDPSLPTVRGWLRQIGHFVRSEPCDWRAVIDALRPATSTLWKKLPYAEQRRFLRHLRPYWDCHRHRIAPTVADWLRALIDQGQLVRHVGRILAYQNAPAGVEVTIRQRGHTEPFVLLTEAVLNCSGSESDYRNLDSPFVHDLLEQELASPDPLRLGLRVGNDGAVVNHEGLPSRRLYAIGPMQKGILWETIAVPEIRGQAAQLAQVLLANAEAISAPLLDVH